MPNRRCVYCPYYVTRSTSDKKMATITCKNIENNLGFDIKNQIVFTTHAEKENYSGLFCSDMFDTCPYYRAIYRYVMKGERDEKERIKPVKEGSVGRKERKGCKEEDVR